MLSMAYDKLLNKLAVSLQELNHLLPGLLTRSEI